MNRKQLQYVTQLSNGLSFSQVAEQMNISQPALSKQIISLEQELGVRLFDRSCSPPALTPAGEHFVREAADLLFREEHLIRSMESFRSGHRGRLTIGISPFRSLYLIPPMVRQFQQKYPHIQISLHEENSDVLRKEAAEGKYDFAVVNLPVDETALDITPIEPDTLVLAVPNPFLSGLDLPSSEGIPEVDLSVFRDIPFIAVSQSQEMRHLFDKLCALSGFAPRIAMEVVGVATAWAMCRSGIGATMLPMQFIRDYRSDNSISLFSVRNNTYLRQPVVVTQRGQYLPDYAHYAISLLTQRHI